MRAAPRVASVWPSEVRRRSTGDSIASAFRTVIARLLRSADFERALRTRSRAHSLHFAVHHVPDRPSVPVKASKHVVSTELSTEGMIRMTTPVDDFAVPVLREHWLGAVVPKRHARRAVTRSLLKRQIRDVVDGHAAALPGGLWVVRLRAPFDRARFVSAASDELKRAARDELERLMCSAAGTRG